MSMMRYLALHLMVRIRIISCCLIHSFFIAHSEFTGDLKLWALASLLHLPCPNSLRLQRSVWGAHARPDRQTALSTGCPFFPPAQPITQSQYKHSFLWCTEPLWKRPFNWSLIKGAQPTLPPPPPQPPPIPLSASLSLPPMRGPFTERSSDKQDRGSKLRQMKALTKACLIKIALALRLPVGSWVRSRPPTPQRLSCRRGRVGSGPIWALHCQPPSLWLEETLLVAKQLMQGLSIGLVWDCYWVEKKHFPELAA